MDFLEYLSDFLNIGLPIFHSYSKTAFIAITIFFIICFVINAIKKRSFSLSIFVSILGVIFFFWIAFCAPNYFLDEKVILSSDAAANVGNTIGGVMSPFIAIGAAVLTFIAFWVQHTANQEMLKNNSKQQLERQFYELLKIHREMVNDFEWEYLDCEMENPSSYNVYKNGFQPYIVTGIAKN